MQNKQKHIVKMLLDYIRDMKRNKNGGDKDVLSENYKTSFYDMARQVNDMHVILNKEDADGRKLCYTPTSHEASLKSLENVISTMNLNMLENIKVLKGLSDVIERIDSDS